MIVAPQRIHHSQFEPLAAHQPPRRRPHAAAATVSTAGRQQVMLATLSNHHQDQQPSVAAQAVARHPAGRNARATKRGSVRDGGGAACTSAARLDRAREDRMSSDLHNHQQLRVGERGSESAAGQKKNEPRAVAAASRPRTLVAAENGRETRGAGSPSATVGGAGSSRSQAQPPQRQHSQRRWARGGGNSSGSGPNSPRPVQSGSGSRPSRKRRSKGEKQSKNSHQTHQPLDPTLSSTDNPAPLSKVEVGPSETPRRKRSSAKHPRGTRPMSSIDSGKGEELSSSCESSVFDPLTPSLESLGERSRHSSCCSVEDEFHDALSHPPSDDDGMTSSAFATPSATPPRSPVPQTSSPHSDLSREVSREKLRNSLKRISNGPCQKSHGQPAESCEDHMTQPTGEPERLHGFVKCTGEISSSAVDTVTSTSSDEQRAMQSSGGAVAKSQRERAKCVGGAVCDSGEVVMSGEGEERVGVVTCVADVAKGADESMNSSSTVPPAQEESDVSVSTIQAGRSQLDSLAVMSSGAIMMSSLSRPSEGSCSGSDASPQSSVCSNSHPHTPPLLSSPSHSPSPSTSSRRSPSPASHRHIVMETIGTDTVAETTDEGTQEWPILDPIATDPIATDPVKTEQQEDEWPDLHSPLEEVKVQPTESSVFSHTQPLDNAAAAYPHVVPHHPHSYPIPWPPYYPIPSTTGPYGYYHCAPHPHPGYYPAPPPGTGFMWPDPHVPIPPHSVPVPYGYSNSRDDNDVTRVDTSETPPTSPGERENQSNRAEENESHNQHTGEEEGECEDRLCEVGKPGELCEGGEGVPGKLSESGEGVPGELCEGGEGVPGELCESGEGVSEERELGEGEDIDGDLVEEIEESECASEIVPLPSCHPLESTWVLWYDRITGNTRNRSCDYRSSLQNLYSVSSVEDFWRLYNNIRNPSGLERNSNYHFFKEGIEPLWEDPSNEQGGKWVLTLKDESLLNRVWEELLLAMIGGVIQSGSAVNGAVVSRRKKGDRVALWTSKKSAKINLNICVDLLRVLAIAGEISPADLPDFIHQLAEGQSGLTLEYMYHRDSLRSGTSYQNSGHIHLKDNCESLTARILELLT